MAGLCWVNDWPWLVAIVGGAWALNMGHWPASPWPLVIQMSVAFGLEIFFAVELPRPRGDRLTVDLGLQGAALAGLALLWGALPGVFLWQWALGADAVWRARRLSQLMERRLLLRTGRFLAAVFLILWH